MGAVIFYGRTFYYCGWTNLGKVMTYIKLGGGSGGSEPPSAFETRGDSSLKKIEGGGHRRGTIVRPPSVCTQFNVWVLSIQLGHIVQSQKSKELNAEILPY